METGKFNQEKSIKINVKENDTVLIKIKWASLLISKAFKTKFTEEC